MRPLILGSVLLAGSIFDLAFSASTASPKSHRLTRRANPSLDSSFGASDTETQQINNAFFDAIELASYAVVADIDTNGPIFAKYFNLADKGTVRSVFMSIMGNPADVMNPGTTGNDLLGKITVTRSDPDGDCAADATLMAQLTQYDTDTPLLEVCPGAGFGHGAIGKDPNKVVCENLGDTVSWRMETLGSILLHEYTHYTNLVVPPLSAETDDLDDGYGPINTRALDKSLAKTNADSYSWYANLAASRIANTQPSYDFITGGSNSPPRPLRQTLRQSQAVKPDIGNEELRSEVKKLQYEIERFKEERDIAGLRHENELRNVQLKAEAEVKRAQALDSNNQVIARKYESLAREFKEAQDQAINHEQALEKQLRTLQNHNGSLQEEADEARTELSSLDRQHAHQLRVIESKHATLQKTLDDLRADLESKSTDLQTVQDRLSQRETEVVRLESDVLRLKAQTGDAETLGVIKKELSNQVAHIKKLESTNREQTTELNHFRRIHKAVEIVEEEKRLLEIKVRMVDDLQKEVREAQLQRQILEDERKSWTSYLQNEGGVGGEVEFESPEALARALVQERLEKLSLVEKLGAVQPDVLEKEEIIKSLETEKTRLHIEVDKLRVSGGSGDSRVRSRLERQRALALKEVDYLREQLRTFDSEETTYVPENKFDEQKQKRIQDLESVVDQYRIELQTLNDELSKREDHHPMAEMPSLKRAREEAEEPDDRLGQLSRKNRKLQDDLSALQQSHALLQRELSASQSQLSSLQQSSRTRILSLRSNPTADAEAVKLSMLTSLRTENKALLAQLEGSPHAAKVVPISTLESVRMEIRDMESMVAEKEKSRLRLRQIYAMKSLEFREAIASILGWSINVMPNGRFRMSSIFNPGEQDEDGGGSHALIFDGETGTMKISGGPSSDFAHEIQHLIAYWVKEKGSIPALLAACTLEFVEKTPASTPTKDLPMEGSGD